MFFCSGTVGLLDDSDEDEWHEVDDFYRPLFHHQFYHPGDDGLGGKTSKMGSLMFVVDKCLSLISYSILPS